MITVVQYFTKPHSKEQELHAQELLGRVAQLLDEWSTATGEISQIDPDTGTEISGTQGSDGDGGFRTPGSRTGSPTATPPSAHRIIDGKGAAVDQYDPRDKIDNWLDGFEDGQGGNSVLEKYGLYREDPSKTPGWCHLQTRPTVSGKRTFMP
jgi:hypothetical protein